MSSNYFSKYSLRKERSLEERQGINETLELPVTIKMVGSMAVSLRRLYCLEKPLEEDESSI
jgi:hypothetical protein